METGAERRARLALERNRREIESTVRGTRSEKRSTYRIGKGPGALGSVLPTPSPVMKKKPKRRMKVAKKRVQTSAQRKREAEAVANVEHMRDADGKIRLRGN